MENENEKESEFHLLEIEAAHELEESKKSDSSDPTSDGFDSQLELELNSIQGHDSGSTLMEKPPFVQLHQNMIKKSPPLYSSAAIEMVDHNLHLTSGAYVNKKKHLNPSPLVVRPPTTAVQSIQLTNFIAEKDRSENDETINIDLTQLNTGRKINTSPMSEERNMELNFEDNYNNTTSTTYLEEEIENSLAAFYSDDGSSITHNKMDLLILYVKSQHHLYHRCYTYYKFQLNMSIIPTLFLSASVALLTDYIYQYRWATLYISTTNAIIALIVAITRYLSPESHAHNFRTISNGYKQLETKLNLTQNQITYMKHCDEKTKIINDTIHYAETQIEELDRNNSASVPPIVKNMLPIISYISIFIFIRHLNAYNADLYQQYKKIKNEIYSIEKYWNEKYNLSIKLSGNINVPIFLQDKYCKDYERFLKITRIKEDIKKSLSVYRMAYTNIDELYSSEIQYAEKHNSFFEFIFKQKRKIKNMKELHPVIRRVLINYGVIEENTS